MNEKISHNQTIGTETQGPTNATDTLASRIYLAHSLELKSSRSSEEMNNKQSEHTKSSGSGTGNNVIF